MIVMLTRVCRLSIRTHLTRPATVTCFREMCSDSESTIISHRRTYPKEETKAVVKQQDDPLWTMMYSKDLLFERIQSATSLDELFGIIDKHHSSLRQRHVKHAFHLLKLMYKSEKVPANVITDSPQFRLLCRATVKLIRTFHSKELLTILRQLIEFHVSPKSLVFQTTIQMLRQGINDLYTENLIFLDHLLNIEVDRTHPADSDQTVGALRIALPLMLEIRLLNNEFDSIDLSILIPALRITVARQLSNKLLNKLMRLVRDHSDNLTYYQYYKVLTALCSPRMTSGEDIDASLANELVSHCLQQFTQLVKSYEWTRKSGDQIIELFHKMTIDNRQEFYSKEFFELVVEALVRLGADSQRLVRAAKSMLRYDYVSLDLVDRVTQNLANEKLHVDFDSGLAIGALQPLVILSHYEPPCGWDCIVNNLFDNKLMADAAVNHTFQYFHILESMALIGKYDSSFYSYMTDALTTMSTRPVPLGAIGQRLLNLSLALRYDDHNLPSEQVNFLLQQLECFVEESIRVLNPIRKNLTSSSSSLLRETIVKALGGEDFVRSGIWSEGGNYHDYLIVMRKGDYPVAIGKEILELDFLHNIKLPDERKLLSIVPLNESDFLREPPQIRRKTDFRINMIKRGGFSVLPINMTDFGEMPKREQIPYLMREIGNAIREN